MAAHANTNRSFNAFNAPFRSKLNERRDVRLRHRAAFYILWEAPSYQPRFARAVSRDVSEHGMSLETSQFIPVGTRFSLRSESGALFGGALVKHAAKHGSRYVLGLEFGHGLLDEAQALMREIYSVPRMV